MRKASPRKTWLLLLIAALIASMALTPALAAGKMSVVQETFIVLPYFDYHAGYVYAEVKNIGDKPVEYSGGLLELYDKDGTSVESTSYLSFYPGILEPGQTGYLYGNQSVEAATDSAFIDDYLLTVVGKGAQAVDYVALTVDAAYYELDESGYWASHYLKAQVTNNTDKTLYDIEVIFAAKDADGKLLYVTHDQPYNVGLPAGSTFIVREDIPSSHVELWLANDVKIATVEAFAFCEID